MSACSHESQPKEEDFNPLLEKIYMKNSFEDTFSFDFIKFYDDNTFQGIETSSFSKDALTGELTANTIDHFGTYSIDKNALTLNISDSTYTGVIQENGSTIILGTEEFIDYTEKIAEDDPIRSKFQH